VEEPGDIVEELLDGRYVQMQRLAQGGFRLSAGFAPEDGGDRIPGNETNEQKDEDNHAGQCQ
jgi:hypothetical protein